MRTSTSQDRRSDIVETLMKEKCKLRLPKRRGNRQQKRSICGRNQCVEFLNPNAEDTFHASNITGMTDI